MSDNSALYLVILAAGKGTRMKSSKAKVLHEVFYAPMLHHVLMAATSLEANKKIVVLGHQRDVVEKSLSGFVVDTVVQEEQLGTGHAVLCAKSAINGNTGCTMILCGDTPLIRQKSLQQMLDQHRKRQSILTVMTTTLQDPTHYGRIVSDAAGNILSIVEQKDANNEQLKIREINAGIYCVDSNFLFSNLQNIGTENSQGEVYLTDIVEHAVKKGLTVHGFSNAHPHDVLGVNSRLELSQAHHELQMRRNHTLMAQGVSMISPETIQVAPTSTVDKDVRLHPGVEISGNSTIQAGCDIKAGSLLHDTTLGSDCTIGAYSCLKGCDLPANFSCPAHSRHC
jgi:bifunctional UDP-N-acetylglucosamine pyrophosphorylase/glucosamine-1-phosphate N-acetyltransferase